MVFEEFTNEQKKWIENVKDLLEEPNVNCAFYDLRPLLLFAFDLELTAPSGNKGELFIRIKEDGKTHIYNEHESADDLDELNEEEQADRAWLHEKKKEIIEKFETHCYVYGLPIRKKEQVEEKER